MDQLLWRALSSGSRADSGKRWRAIPSRSRRTLWPGISDLLPPGSGQAQVTTETPMCFDALVHQDRRDSSAGRCLPPTSNCSGVFASYEGGVFDALEGGVPREAE